MVLVLKTLISYSLFFKQLKLIVSNYVTKKVLCISKIIYRKQ
jgi:hypothetical protein